jgi:hypothetical protein
MQAVLLLKCSMLFYKLVDNAAPCIAQAITATAVFFAATATVKDMLVFACVYTFL